MQYTKSQRELIELSREPIKGFKLDVVEVTEDFSGVGTVLKFIRRQPYKNQDHGVPRNITIEAARPWDVVMGLVAQAGRKTLGSGYLDTVWKALAALSEDRRPLCLWFDDVRYMRPTDREMIVCLLEWISEHLEIPIRIVMLVGKVRVWSPHVHKRVSMFVHSARLDLRSRKLQFSREGLENIAKFDTEEEQLEAMGERQHRAAV